MAIDLSPEEFVIVAAAPVVALAAVKSPAMRKLAWAGFMLFLSIWAMHDAIKIVRS